MTAAAVAFLAFAQAAAGSSGVRIGVAAADARQHCLSMHGEALGAGSPVALVALEAPQRVYRAVVAEAVEKCPVLSEHLAPEPHYRLAPDAAEGAPPSLAVAVIGRPAVTVTGGEARLRLGDRLREARVRRCSSSEGLHLTVWSGAPLRSTRLWHLYWYLGYDVVPDCRPGDYV